MNRLRRFDSVARNRPGPTGFVFVGLWTDEGRITPELRTIEEIEAHEQLLMGELSEAFAKLKREFRKLQRKPRVPFFLKG